MLKNLLIGLVIGGVLSLTYFSTYVVGLYNAPEPSKYEQLDDLQYLCDTARREPWKADLVTSCQYMQDWWALDYKCEEVIGCFTVARKAES